MRFAAKYTISSAILLTLAFATQDVAAQAGSASRRGSLKVQARYFNPFDPSASSRFSVNRFGFPQVGDSSSFVLPGFPEEEPVATEESAVEESPVVEAAPVVAESTSAPEPVPVAPGLGGGVVNSSGRPDYRPPTRSPYRPPPRPPF